jgi:hypothetical protein
VASPLGAEREANPLVHDVRVEELVIEDLDDGVLDEHARTRLLDHLVTGVGLCGHLNPQVVGRSPDGLGAAKRSRSRSNPLGLV